MAKTQQAIFSFSAGVLTPRITTRADSDKYSQALQIGENFIITPQGGAIFRQGFEYLDQVNNGRMFQFHQGGNESDILIFVESGGNIEFFGDSTATYNTLVNVHSYTDLEELQFVNQERYGILVHPDFPPRYLEIVNGQFTTVELAAAAIPEYDFKDTNSPASATNLSTTYTWVFLDYLNEWSPSKTWSLRYDGVTINSPSDYEFSTDAATIESRMLSALGSIAALNQDPDTSYTVDGSVAGTVIIVITGPNSGKVLEGINPRISDNREITVSTTNEDFLFEFAWSYPTYVLHSGTYYQCILSHTAEAGVNEPPNTTYWTALVGKPDTFDWQYYDNETQTSVHPWTDGAVYSPGDRGFPRVPCFHEQRLIFGGTPSATTALWGSRIGDYKDFKTGVNQDDPFAFTLDTSDTPAIKWMRSQIRLMIGTSAGDWRVSADISLGPTDIQAFKQNNARSYNTGAISVDVNIFYIEQGNTKLRTTRYSDDLNSFTSIDVTILAEHLFHQGVKRVVLMQNPEVLIIALRQDGSLAAMTYDPANGMGAWVELTTQGFIWDIATYYSTVSNEDELYVQIAYNYSEAGPNTWQIERMPYPSRTFTPYEDVSDETLIAQGVICLDSWQVGTMTNNVITGLSRLDGQTVGVLIDDAWTGAYVVQGDSVNIADIQITGTEPYTGEYAVGLMYEGNLKTFEVTQGNNYQRGTGLGTLRRWAKLYVRLLNSALPIINGDLPPDRTPEMQMNLGDIITMGLSNPEIRGEGWGDGSVTIQQNRPYPTQILGLYGEFQLGND